MDKQLLEPPSVNHDTEILKKHKKIEEILEKTEQRNKNNQQILEEVAKGSESLFGQIPLANPTGKELHDSNFSYNLYYKKLRKLMRLYIPKGMEGKKIRDEINLFLKEGQTKGGDGRMAYKKVMLDAVNTIIQWANDYKGGQLTDLLKRFEDLNSKYSVLLKV